VCHISAIRGTGIRTFEANSTAARCRVLSCFARRDSRFSRTASSCSNGRTNTDRGRITTSRLEMRPYSTPPRQDPAGYRLNVSSRATRRIAIRSVASQPGAVPLSRSGRA